ncbi:MAG: EAL domain-containing protein [Lachnospiraceae bacterium]|nr:EAL domain-containing protein [Lachnospiraceae bacterium]
MMRIVFAAILGISVILLSICSRMARRSSRMIGRAVGFLECALIPPIIGNAVIIVTDLELVAVIGCYMYFIGMDLLMFALIRFTVKYCSAEMLQDKFEYLMYVILVADVVQYIMNPFMGQAFSVEKIEAYGYAYYRMIPYLGQTFHRVIDYGIMVLCLGIFIQKIVITPKIYREKYSIILFTMLVVTFWETFYIFSRSPIDRSMVGFAFFGIMIFYFAIIYKPRRLLDKMLADIASEMSEAIYFFDASGRCIWANEPGEKLINVEGSYDRVPLMLNDMFGQLDYSGRNWSMPRTVGREGNVRYYELRMKSLSDGRNNSDGALLSVRDNTDAQKRLSEKMYAATHDTLTGLYTKEYLYEKVRDKLIEEPDVDYNIVYVNVRNFKMVNDIFGTDFGDYVIKFIADWIREDMTDMCVYGRLVGDTFGILVPKEEFESTDIEGQLEEFAVRRGDVEHHITIHIGVYNIADRSLDISVMFDRAHLALSYIKDDIRRHIAYYDDDMRYAILWNQEISARLPEAIRRRELKPYLQPIVDVSGKVMGAEALVRWIHPDKGFLAPYKFIPVFEKNGMIVQVDRYMWRCACELLAKWHDRDLFISVNISPKDFYFMDVRRELVKLVEEFEIDPVKLRIEITETLMMNNSDSMMAIIEDLRKEGFIVEMDDFGSGYSSLNLLKDMPVDVLKVDMAFLRQSDDNPRAVKILDNIMKLSSDLDIVSLTEGVETSEQFTMLTQMGCKLFQGYYFAKPMPVEDFEKFAQI